MYRLFLKRLIDILVSTFLLMLLAPLFILVLILVKLDSPGPAFYTQYRVGQFCRPFKIFKFRSMVVNNSSTITAGYNDERITKIGKIIRLFHIDELPQLFNIIKGDMSLVGSRPEVAETASYYPEARRTVLQVRPGITGLASVKCADYQYQTLEKAEDKEWVYVKKILPKKLRYELFYTQHLSFMLDLLIICWTIKKIALLTRSMIQFRRV